MTDIDNIKLRQLDLTLLVIFLRLLELGKARLVGEALGLTQSSISHALGRLRHIFADPLFLRQPHGLEPTARALALEAPIRQAVEALYGAISPPNSFDAANSTQTIRLGAYDGELACLIPPLLAECQTLAPRLRWRCLSIGRQAAMAALRSQQLDLALGYFWQIGEEFIQQPLYEENFLVVGQPQLITQDKPLSLDAYLSGQHLIVSPQGDLHGIVDESLAQQGLSRQVVAALPLFFPALASAAHHPFFLTLPARLAKQFAPAFGLAWTQAPLQLRSFKISALYHRRHSANPLYHWLLHIFTKQSHTLISHTPPLKHGANL
jgi:DNA-binding transcriptional LysR family regulator